MSRMRWPNCRPSVPSLRPSNVRAPGREGMTAEEITRVSLLRDLMIGLLTPTRPTRPESVANSAKDVGACRYDQASDFCRVSWSAMGEIYRLGCRHRQAHAERGDLTAS